MFSPNIICEQIWQWILYSYFSLKYFVTTHLATRRLLDQNMLISLVIGSLNDLLLTQLRSPIVGYHFLVYNPINRQSQDFLDVVGIGGPGKF